MSSIICYYVHNQHAKQRSITLYTTNTPSRGQLLCTQPTHQAKVSYCVHNQHTKQRSVTLYATNTPSNCWFWTAKNMFYRHAFCPFITCTLLLCVYEPDMCNSNNNSEYMQEQEFLFKSRLCTMQKHNVFDCSECTFQLRVL